MLAMFTGVSLEYEVELVLRAAEVRSVSLGGQGQDGRLGWDAFVVEAPQDGDRREVRYLVESM
jgi:type VI secretion system protein ImpH